MYLIWNWIGLFLDDMIWWWWYDGEPTYWDLELDWLISLFIFMMMHMFWNLIMASPCIGFEIGLGHICWYFRAYICSKILKVLHPCIGFGIGLGHIWGHANAWIWYIHAYAWILYIHVLSHISHIPKAEIFGFMFQYLSSERMGLRFWANPIHNTWLDHGEISRTRCTPFCPVMHS